MADWLVSTFEVIRPYGNTIVGVVAVIAMVFAGWLWWTRQSALDRGTAWNDVFIAQLGGDPAKLTDVAEKYPGTAAAAWADVVAGDVYLSNGCDELFTSKANATVSLNKAVECFKNATKQVDEPALRQRATYGLARTYEALSGTAQSELAKATEAYKEVVTKWPDGTYAKAAQRRLNDLEQPATKKFYDQFAKYDPKPAFKEEPGKGLEGLDFSPSAIPLPEALPPASGSKEPAKSAAPKSEAPAAQPAEAKKPAASESVPSPPPPTQ